MCLKLRNPDGPIENGAALSGFRIGSDPFLPLRSGRGWLAGIYLRVSLSFNPGQLKAAYCMTRAWRHSVPFFLE